MPNEHIKEIAFFLMFGRDVYTLLVQVLNPKLRYADNDKTLLFLDAFLDMYALVIHNIKLSRER